MNETDELRRLLDERGVEHGDVESAPYPPYNSTRRMTTFWANKWVWQYIEDEREGGDIELEGRYMSMSVTPTQAIAATLGEGTCQLKRASWDDGTCTWGCICSACDAHLEHETGIGYNYCPVCGAKVVTS